MNQRILILGCLAAWSTWQGVTYAGVDTGEFGYQGQLKLDGALPGDQVGSALTFDGGAGNPAPVEVANGLFSVVLDFGPTAFTDDARWLEVAVRCPAAVGDYTVLAPREAIVGAPHAVHTRGIFVGDAGDVGLGTNNPHEKLEVNGNIAVAVEGFDPYIELMSDGAADATTMHLTTLDVVGFAVTDERHDPKFVVRPTGDIGMGTTRPEAPLHVTGAGRFRGNHLAFFHSRSGPQSDGIAIQLDNPSTNRENNFITFYNGREGVTGRIEGFDLENGDWIAPPPLPDIGMTLDPGITYNPTWFNPGTLPTASFNRGQLPTASFSRGQLPTASFNQGQLPSLTFSGGSFPSANFSRGSLPTASFNDGSLPSFSANYCTVVGIRVLCGFNWSAGSTPSLNFSGGSLPSLTFSRGSLPTASFGVGRLPSLTFSGGALPNLTFSGGALPSLTFSGGSLPSVEKSPIVIGEPSLTFDLPTEEELEALFCWSYETGLSDFVSLDPVGVAVERLKEQVAMRCKDEGVTYGSKGADYAEWLPKLNPSDQFQIGQIVGVHGGKVSLETEGAEQIMAISKAPVVVGNVPAEEEKQNFVTVGFMGQLPVVVRGKAKPGDYIIPSGREDGTAVAVSPEDLALEHLGRTLGRAWSESDNDVYSLINVAIGLDGYEAKTVLRRHREQIDTQARNQDALVAENSRLKAELNAMDVKLTSLMASFQKLEERVHAQAACPQTVAVAGRNH